MRRIIHLALVLALLLPYGLVALAQEQPITEEEVAPDATPTAVIFDETQAQFTPAPEGAPDGQGGGMNAPDLAQPQGGISLTPVPAPFGGTGAPPPAGGSVYQEGFGFGGYYPPGGYNPNLQYPGYTQHYVRYGDNLFRISLRYGVPISAIVAANPFITNINLIYAGTVLLIPTGGTQPPTVVPPTPGTPGPGPGYSIHVVRPGEWIYLIARLYGVSPLAIIRANYLIHPNLIYPGQQLIIPLGGGTYPPPPTVVPPPVTVTPGPPPDGAFELGGHVFDGYEVNVADMLNAGMTWGKVQVRWTQGQGVSIVQGDLDAIRAQGFKVLLSVIGNPEQIRANPAQYYQDFAAFLGDVAALNPDAIEVWNEQNIDREWPNGLISPASYTQMLSAAYQAIKAANPNVLVISGAPAPTGFFGGACTGTGCDDQPFIQGMAANGAANFLDCVGIHYNEGILPPTATSGDPRGNGTHYTRYYPSMVNVYTSVFPNKPLCFTELGYLTPEGYPPLPTAFDWAQGTSVSEHAEWLAGAAQLSRSSGRVRLMIVWNVNATEYGADPQAGYAIIRPGNQCPACVALNAVMQ